VNPYPQMGKYSPEWAYSTAWAYVAPDGREYGLLASYSGVSVFRLTNPNQPVQVGFVNLRNSGWHESRQYGTRVYITTEVFNGEPSTDGLEIVDMSDPEHPQKVPYAATIQWAHSLEVDTARGLLYTNGTNRGVVIYSLANPDKPVEITIPKRAGLEALLAGRTLDPGLGPFARRASDAVTGRVRVFFTLLAHYDRLADAARAEPDGFVLTHGEPHLANFLRVDGRLVGYHDTLGRGRRLTIEDVTFGAVAVLPDAPAQHYQLREFSVGAVSFRKKWTHRYRTVVHRP